MKKVSHSALRLTVIAASIGLFAVGLNSCVSNSEEELYPLVDVSDDVSWSDDVKPIIDANCAIPGCHLDVQLPMLTTYEEVSGQLDRINERALVRKDMPPSGPLSSTDQLKLRNWINDGGPDN